MKYIAKVFGWAMTLFFIVSACRIAVSMPVNNGTLIPVLLSALALLLVLKDRTEIQNKLDVALRVLLPPYAWWTGPNWINAALVVLSFIDFLRLVSSSDKSEEEGLTLKGGSKQATAKTSADSKPNEAELQNAYELDFARGEVKFDDWEFQMFVEGDTLRVKLFRREWRNVPLSRPLTVVINVSDPENFEALQHLPTSAGRTPSAHRVFWVLKSHDGAVIAGPTADPGVLSIAIDKHLWDAFSVQCEADVIAQYKKSGPPLV